MHLPRRILDTIRTLLGRTEAQAEARRIRSEWLQTEIEINEMFERVNMLIARLAKRESRAAKDAPPAPTDIAPPLTADRKTAIRQRIRQHQFRANGE